MLEVNVAAMVLSKKRINYWITKHSVQTQYDFKSKQFRSV